MDRTSGARDSGFFLLATLARWNDNLSKLL